MTMALFTPLLALLLTACALRPVAVEGYGTGAPKKACVSLTPGHNNTSPQDTEAPYSLEVSAHSYEPMQKLTLKITGAPYQGFIIQARLAHQPGMSGHEAMTHHHDDPATYGTFSLPPDGARLMECHHADSTITHSNSAEKAAASQEFTWTAPHHGVGDLQFHFTVAENHDTYWTHITSMVIQGPDDMTKKNGHHHGTATAMLPSCLTLVALLASAAILKLH